MYIPHTKYIKLSMLLLILISFFACSKDTDLLSEYVLSADDESLVVRNVFVDDSFIINGNKEVILDVLSNDTIVNPEGVKITQISQPIGGQVTIIEGSSISYVPKDSSNAQEETTDTFTYTTQTNQNGGSTTSEETTVVVTKINDKLKYWKASFDAEWSRSLSFYKSQSSGTEVSGQRRYYDFRVIDGLIAMVQATGDLKYIDDLVWYVDRIKNEAKQSSDGYWDWPVGGENYPLYDGHGFRNIHKFLYLAKTYPAIKSRMTTAKYNDWLSFFTVNLYDKWKSRGNSNLMRSNTHMSSHFASNMCLYLYLLEDNSAKKEEYLSWVNAWNKNVDSKQDWSGAPNTGFRDQLRTVANKYIWAAKWGSNGTTTDHSHANAEVQAVVNQHHQGIEWTSNDMTKFVATIDAMLDSSPDVDYSKVPYRVDAVYDSKDANNRNNFNYGWAMLGRFDSKLQIRLEEINPSQSKTSNFYNCVIGIMAYNQAYLDDELVYPEF